MTQATVTPSTTEDLSPRIRDRRFGPPALVWLTGEEYPRRGKCLLADARRCVLVLPEWIEVGESGRMLVDVNGRAVRMLGTAAAHAPYGACRLVRFRVDAIDVASRSHLERSEAHFVFGRG
jgi:hypothetical protein